MKTSREILFQRHEAAESKLDAIRREVLQSELRSEDRELSRQAENAPWWRGFIRDFRGQLAAMTAVWLLVMFFRLGAGDSPVTTVSLASQKFPAYQVSLAVLRANQLQLLELVEFPETRPAAAAESLPNRPRSARRMEILSV